MSYPAKAPRETSPAIVESGPERTALAVQRMNGMTVEAMRKTLFASPIPQNELWRTYYGGNVDLLRIESALNGANVGNMRPLTDLSREILDRDPQLGSLALRRFGKLSTLRWAVSPAQGEGIDPKRALDYAQVVRQQLARIPNFRTRIKQLAYGQYDGRAALEKLWERNSRGGPVKWFVKALGWIHPRRLQFGPDREFRVVDSSYSAAYFTPVGEALRDYPFKFIEFRSHLFCEYPEREGLGPRSLYWSFFKRFTWRERLVLLELFGKPWRIIEVDPLANPQPESLEAADLQIQALGGSQTARLPQGAKLNLLQPTDNAGRLHESTAKDVDDQMSKLWFGHTLTTDAKPQGLGGGGQAQTADDQQELVHQIDAGVISEALKEQLTDEIIVMNFGADALDHAPGFELVVDEETDPGVETDRLGKVLSTGLRVSLSEAYERTGWKPPEEDEPVLQMTAAPTQEGGGPGAVARATIVYPAGQSPDPGEVQIAPGAGGPPLPANDPELDEETGEIGATEDDEVAATRGHRHSVECARQPDTVNGSPDTLVEKGVRESARETGKWAGQIADAMEGLSDAGAILRRLRDLPGELNVQPLARVAERRLMHGVMLGALDSGWERENDRAVAPEKFAAPQLPGVPEAEPAFAAKPYDAAVKWFRSKAVVDKATFEHLSARAKSRAFTVAGMARQDLLEAAHDELGRQIQQGADLRLFKGAVKARLESAGWTPVNPSHVETIYRTNVMSAYGAGRHAEMTQPAVLAARPYWRILGPNDGRTRPTHKAVHGLVLRASDPFFKRAIPPFGYNCRDRVQSLSEADVQRMGLTVVDGSTIRGLPDDGFTSGTGSLL